MLCQNNTTFSEYKLVSKQNVYLNNTLRNEENDWVFKNIFSDSLFLIQ